LIVSLDCTVPASLNSTMNWLTSRILDAESQIKSLVTVAAATLDSLVPEDANNNNSKEEDLADIGIDPTIMEFVESICNHPNTFRDFPLENYGNSPKKLTPKQEKHAMLMLDKVPELSQLRYKLCPGVMKEEKFWRVYFLILQNKIGYIFSDEVIEEQDNTTTTTTTPDAQHNADDNTSPTTTTTGEQTSDEYSVKSKFSYEHEFTTPDKKRRGSKSNSKTTPSPFTPPPPPRTPQTPAEIEDYFERIWTPVTTPVDEGIEPDYDSYFSPRRLTYEIETQP